jgi:hypothetical protein
MMGKEGPAFPANTFACTRFEARPVAPPPPRSAKEKFLAPESWRKSSRTPGNLVRSVLGTPLTVTVFRRLGYWSWTISDATGGPPVFSERLHESREAAQADCWEREIAAVVEAEHRS